MHSKIERQQIKDLAENLAWGRGTCCFLQGKSQNLQLLFWLLMIFYNLTMKLMVDETRSAIPARFVCIH